MVSLHSIGLNADEKVMAANGNHISCCKVWWLSAQQPPRPDGESCCLLTGLIFTRQRTPCDKVLLFDELEDPLFGERDEKVLEVLNELF